MLECKKCRACFRDSYNLNKHMSRIKPCVSSENGEFSTSAEKVHPNSSKSEPKTAKGEPKTAKGELKTAKGELKTAECQFCMNKFATSSSLKRHNPLCKHRDDPVRLLEIENEICPELPESKTECRFCNHNFFNVNNLYRHISVCKERALYHKKLLKRKEPVATTTIINNNNHGTINNNNITIINLFGEESLDHISNDEFLRYIIKNYKIYKQLTNQDEINSFSGKFLLEFDRMITKNPKNNNTWITNIKSDFGYISNNCYRFEDFILMIIENLAKNISKREDLFLETSENDISFSSLMLSDAYDYTNNYQTLHRKKKKEINDIIRIQKSKG
jgi:hypothetical protein